MYTVAYSDHSCFTKIVEFVKFICPTNMKGSVSSSSSYVDPCYHLRLIYGTSSLYMKHVGRKKGNVSDCLWSSCISLYPSPSHLEAGANTISANQSLSGDHTIISEGEQFELGFFKAGNSSKYYTGIWYNKVSSNPPTIVWVANRETPISDRFRSELKIIDGNLVLLNESKFQIWSTNVSTTTTLKSVIAVILDDGNLVLRDSTSNSIEPFWQSFDHLTHTWLSGSKLGYDYRTKKSQIIRSWRSNEDPAVGLFSLEFYPPGNEYVIKWNGSQQYWRSGAWNGKIFDLIPEMRLDYIYNFSYHTNENESYFTYSVRNPSIMTRSIMDVSGQIQQLTWLEATKEWNLFWSQPRTQCEVYALCGAFGICRQSGLPFCNCLTGFKPRSESD
ncbi:G-type lectin S-receptor-like serine/threonine-protein kinase At2g19130 [Lactuca sativa]|uniref:G-type lectin S-receptor-like serine/threonine-protein kinase At2g19130 n=1 Tax=Lactuca sativa TaxID=4236 RepID=UPI0022AFBD4A|nr:G-type lectin S-receptor-like serine/threonine-protein kinase At2g19130 [Lactuca sativa]